MGHGLKDGIHTDVSAEYMRIPHKNACEMGPYSLKIHLDLPKETPKRQTGTGL